MPYEPAARKRANHARQDIDPGDLPAQQRPQPDCRSFPDPAAVVGTEAEKLAKVRKIRDMIKDWLLTPPQNTFDAKRLFRKP